MLRSLFFVVLLSSFHAVAAEDPLPRSRPESMGMSSERLERIGQVLRADIEKGRMPGAVMSDPFDASGFAPRIRMWSVRSTSGIGTLSIEPNIKPALTCFGIWSTVDAE